MFVPEVEGDGAVIDGVSSEDGEVSGDLAADGEVVAGDLAADGGEVVGVPADGETASILSFIHYIILRFINKNREETKALY